MKVLVSTDIEGVAGVFHPEQTRAGNAEYERARRWMTAEANAAIEGAFAGGASEVWVNDSHGGFRNLLPDLLDARARVVLGKPRTLGMMAGLEYGAALVFMIGYHARAQTGGILAHTINSGAFAQIRIDGTEAGEAELYGAVAEQYGARVALLSGDDVFAAQTQPRFPGARFVVVKQATGQTSGVSDSPERACAAIRHAAQEAVQHNANAPHPASQGKPSPILCELRTATPAYADLFCQWPALERIDAMTLRFEAANAEHTVRMLNCLSAMSFMLR
jgi:D-amino peptidase